MSQSEKAQLYNELKAAGVQFDKHYREYNTKELGEAVARLRERQFEEGTGPDPDAPPPAPEFDPQATAAALAAMQQRVNEQAVKQAVDQAAEQAGLKQPVASAPPVAPAIPRPAPQVQAPVAPRNPNEMPGVRQNTREALEPIRVDPETGQIWYQEEVRKPAFPKPRGRRVLKYMDTGVREETVKDGKYVETFEVAGDGQGVPAEVKITLPSYQVGIYKDPRLPFRIHVYNGRQGFDLFEVQDYYNGPELVPADIKRVYIENVLCYDIRTTVRAIQNEYRQLQLTGKVK